MGANVTAGVSGWSEFAPHIASGRLRAIGVSAPARLDGIDAPTLREQGLDVELENWRAVMAPPGLSRDDRQRLGAVVERMVRSATWRRTLADRGWTDTYLAGPEFARYLDSERVRLARIITRLRGPGGEPIRAGERVFPAVILLGSAAVAALLVVGRRKAPPRARIEASNRRTVLGVAAGLVAFVVLLEPAGFIVAATALFVTVMRALGNGRALAGLPTALLFSALVYLAFTRGLDLALPAGSLWPWIR
jgi:hypothetical protein